MTGARGLVGRHTLPLLLDKGFEVHGVGRQPRPADVDSSVRWHTCNLLDSATHPELIHTVKPTHLLHLAWYAVPGKYWTSEQNVYWTQATLSLARQFGEGGGHRLVAAGTCAEYDWSHELLSENETPLKPMSPYAICKNATRELLSLYCEQHAVSFAWGRIFFVYGPHEPEKKLISSVIRSLKEGKKAACTEGRQIRDFIYVDDAACLFAALVDGDFRGSVNVCSGTGVSIREIVENIARQFNREDLIQWGAIPTPENDPPRLVGDSQTLQSRLSWKPGVDLEEGIKKTIDFYLNPG
ncbi:MAG: NAD-dependent epimerase/dehydratase family protein [Nitrospinaceae bacterium]|nr:NAD-dependent epimerase/dehydratase family protein [Nitrospinaceae bacterium]NIX36213.1 NAD-dependent epimerase/dehydratase family protein [Nitrospinaceae bacterium]